MLLDPLPVGVTSVTSVTFYRNEDRSDSPTPVLADHSTGKWLVDTLPLLPYGRTYPMVNAMQGSTPYDYPVDHLDLPEAADLILSPEELADEIGLPLPLSTKSRRILLGAIRASQAKVTAYLGRPLFPTTYVEEHAWPYLDGWHLTKQGDDEVTSVVSVAAEVDLSSQPTGYYTVTFIAGLDVKNDPTLAPIREYVFADAGSSQSVVNIWREVTGTKGEIKSASAEGQSVSYGDAFPVGAPPPSSRSGSQTQGQAPGALPLLNSLDFWRVAGRRVFQGATRYGADDGAW